MLGSHRSHVKETRPDEENMVCKEKMLSLSFDLSDDDVLNPLILAEEKVSKPPKLNGMLFLVIKVC